MQQRGSFGAKADANHHQAAAPHVPSSASACGEQRLRQMAKMGINVRVRSPQQVMGLTSRVPGTSMPRALPRAHRHSCRHVANTPPSFRTHACDSALQPDAQLEVDAALVSPVSWDGRPQPGCDTQPGRTVRNAARRKHRQTYPEFDRGRRCCLVVLDLVVGGRRSHCSTPPPWHMSSHAHGHHPPTMVAFQGTTLWSLPNSCERIVCLRPSRQAKVACGSCSIVFSGQSLSTTPHAPQLPLHAGRLG